MALPQQAVVERCWATNNARCLLRVGTAGWAIPSPYAREFPVAGTHLQRYAAHRSWFTAQADNLLAAQGIARVAADPPRSPGDGAPGGARALAYYRLHGAPQTYYSNYDSNAFARLGRTLAMSRLQAAQTWCIFDNTAAHAALGNAISVQRMAAHLV